MISLVVVIIHKLSNMSLQFFRTLVMLEFNNILHRPVVSLDFSVGLWMKWFPANMSNGLFFQELFQIT